MIRRCLRILFTLLALLPFLMLIPEVRLKIAKRALSALEVSSGLQLSVDIIDWQLPLTLSLERASLRMGEEEVAVDRLVCEIFPLALLFGELRFTRLEIDGLQLDKVKGAAGWGVPWNSGGSADAFLYSAEPFFRWLPRISVRRGLLRRAESRSSVQEVNSDRFFVPLEGEFLSFFDAERGELFWSVELEAPRSVACSGACHLVDREGVVRLQLPSRTLWLAVGGRSAPLSLELSDSLPSEMPPQWIFDAAMLSKVPSREDISLHGEFSLSEHEQWIGSGELRSRLYECLWTFSQTPDSALLSVSDGLGDGSEELLFKAERSSNYQEAVVWSVTRGAASLVKGYTSWKDGELALGVDRLDLSGWGERLQLENPFSIVAGGGKVEALSPLNLLWNERAAVSLHPVLHWEALSLELSVEHLPLEWVSDELQGDAKLVATLNSHSAAFSAEIRKIIHAAWPGDPASMMLQGSWQDEEFQLVGALHGAVGDTPLMLRAVVSVPETLFGLPALPAGDSPFSFDLEGDGDLSGLLELLMPNRVAISAQGTLSLHGEGSWQKPELYGRCELIHGRIEDLDSGLAVQELSALISAEKERVFIESLRATSGSGQTVSGSGLLLLEPAMNFPYACTLSLDRLAVVRFDFLQLLATGPLQIHGDFHEMVLSGDLQATPLAITLPDRAPKGVTTLPILWKKEGNDRKEAVEEPPSKDEFVVRFDCRVEIPQATISDENLSSQWYGECSVSGRDGAMELWGHLRLSQGQYFLNGKPFKLSHGLINCAGDPLKKITVYLIASRQIDQMKIDVILKGNVQDPTVTFRSQPPLSRRDILSWLLFEHGAGAASPKEEEQLRASLRALTALREGKNPMDRLRNLLPFDRIDIDRVGDDTVSVGVGRYLTENVYISLRRDLIEECSRVGIHARLMPRVGFDAEVADNAATSFRLKWYKDY